jgi:hypothetical protein
MSDASDTGVGVPPLHEARTREIAIIIVIIQSNVFFINIIS